MIIEKLINLDDCLLAVFFTRGSCWQYSILFPDSSFYFAPEIYYTKDAAERVGIEAIKLNLGRKK